MDTLLRWLLSFWQSRRCDCSDFHDSYQRVQSGFRCWVNTTVPFRRRRAKQATRIPAGLQGNSVCHWNVQFLRSNAFLKDVAFIIFFNKVCFTCIDWWVQYDLFVKKIRDEPLSYFPEEKSVYKGDGSATSAAEFIRDQFTASSKNHKLYSHFTTATDTQNCERVKYSY